MSRALRWRALLRAAAGRGAGRLRTAAWPIGQCALAAMLAWYVARHGLGHPRPFFAPTAAVICLGPNPAQRLRRVIELGFGVTLGIAIGDVLARQIGSGWWQLGLVVVLAAAAAQFFDGGALVTAQSVVQAIFLVALPQQPGSGFSRWEDAFVGAAAALLIAVLLPTNPTQLLRGYAHDLITELAGVVNDTAAALSQGSSELADAALDRARGTQAEVERWRGALIGSEETSRISPLRRGHRDEIARYRQALVGVDRATRNMRVAVRRVAAELDAEHPLPPTLVGLFADLGIALRALRHEVGEPLNQDGVTAGALRAIAVRLDPQALQADSLPATVIVGQFRSAVVDLMGAIGISEESARALLPH